MQYSLQYCQHEHFIYFFFLHAHKPLWIKAEDHRIPLQLFPYCVLPIWEYSMQCVLGADILNKFIILSGFHPCINKSMKILSEHILMCANSVQQSVFASGTQSALVSSDAVCFYCRLHVEKIKRKHILVGPDRIKHQWVMCEGSELC